MIQTIGRALWFSLFLMSALIASLADAQTYEPSNIDKALYFNANIRDAEFCSMVFSQENQQLLAVNKYNGKIISNPAMTCPDMFSWKLFAESVEDQFWRNWADQKQNWPNEPYPLCAAGQSPPADQCCAFGNNQNSQGHCPIYPGNKTSSNKTQDPLRSTSASLHGAAISKSEFKQRIKNAKKQSRSNQQSCSAVEINGSVTDVRKQIYATFAPENSESIGRIIRQTSTELTLRNQPFHDYLFKNNLYNTSGLLAIYNQNNDNLQNSAPYHLRNQSATRSRSANLSRIDLPPDAVMMKSNWVHQALYETLAERFAKQYATKFIQAHGGRLNAEQKVELDNALAQRKESAQSNQFIHTANISTDINLQALGISHEERHCNLTGTHYLLSFHISSKDIPNWVWATFEHVNLPGRCDLTGCNDSYGFKSSDKRRPEGTADNYVAANQHSDNLSDGQIVFDNDAGYPAEDIRPEWEALLNTLNIGTEEKSAIEPSAADKAWRHYRLKGSQVEFVNAKGMPTILGNSITEAGFMEGSSCISCHSRATIAPNLNPVPGDTAIVSPLSMFQRDVSAFGYRRGTHGIPNPNWFYNDHSDAPKVEALQTDFIWGFLFAKDVVPASKQP
ncbi:hypothetical protein C0J08_13055 [Marinomonas sp. CT5]|uniref:hypothetical protein n=1 Tax=Marinomonas sp. CT5 TaxID=2066133 RepID=UPI001BAF61F9|nr:hypothetical protein [Marinomonas sp. CT5]QUX96263.1 hypothetical protein C0J08_13055 [Marinomonas sp. CT5]